MGTVDELPRAINATFRMTRVSEEDTGITVTPKLWNLALAPGI